MTAPIPHAMAPDDRFRQAPAVLATRLSDDDLVLLHTGTQHYHALNGTAGAVWDALAAPVTLAEVAVALSAGYAVDGAAAAAAARETVERLVAAGLAERVG